MSWFRPPIRCVDGFEVWLLVWNWIGVVHVEGWYAERLKR